MRELILIMALGISAGVFATEVESKKVTQLHVIEAFNGHRFHNGYLWTGRRASSSKGHQLEIYSKDGSAKLGAITLKHNVSLIEPYKSGVIVVGLAFDNGYASYYTVVSLNGNKVSSKSYKIRNQQLVDYLAIVGNDLYFTDIGARRVLKTRVGSTNVSRVVATGISNPGPLVYQNGSLYILERRGLEKGDESLTRVNLKTGKLTRVSGDKFGRPGASEIVAFDNKNLVAVTERTGEQIAFFNTKSQKYVAEVAVHAEVTGISKYKNCVVGIDAFSKQLVFVDTRDFSLVDSWNIEVTEFGEQELPHNITVNEKDGIFFTRSSVPHMFAPPELQPNYVYAFNGSKSKTISKCE